MQNLQTWNLKFLEDIRQEKIDEKLVIVKVLLVNGSPHKEWCTYTALCEVADAFNKNGIELIFYR